MLIRAVVSSPGEAHDSGVEEAFGHANDAGDGTRADKSASASASYVCVCVCVR